MKLILTERQARAVLQALEWAENPDYSDSDSGNAVYIRIEKKIRRLLGEERNEPTRAERVAENRLERRFKNGDISQAEFMAEWEKIHQ